MIWPQCSRYPSLEGHLDFWMDYLKNVPFSVDEYQYLLEKSQSRANQSSRAPLCSTLTNETHSITQPPTKVATLATSEPNLAKSKDVSIEMEGLSRAKKIRGEILACQLFKPQMKVSPLPLLTKFTLLIRLVSHSSLLHTGSTIFMKIFLFGYFIMNKF